MDAVVTNSRDMIRRGSRSFAAAARIFRRDIRESAYMLYAWCRYCDDQIDGQDLGMSVGPPPPGQPSRLARLEEQTRRALAGETMDDPVFAGFQRVALRHHIPARHPLDLLAGFAMDVADHRYHTLDETLLYCYRVAGVVGVMMGSVMGVRGLATLERAADLGIAFQLTNIARDVMDDARNERCYLPVEWLEEEGVPVESVLDPAYRPAVARVVARLLAVADRYYASAQDGLRDLPFRSAWAVATALAVYRDIGRIVLAREAAAWDRRAVVSGTRKLAYAASGCLRALQAITVDRRAGKAPRSRDLWALPDLAPGE